MLLHVKELKVRITRTKITRSFHNQVLLLSSNCPNTDGNSNITDCVIFIINFQNRPCHIASMYFKTSKEEKFELNNSNALSKNINLRIQAQRKT